MAFDTAIITLLHILVFVYWLGGDLGAFYTSRYLTADGVSPDRRLMAAKIVGDVDMAPRTALIMALPTGLLLALTNGWINGPVWWGWLAMGLGVIWLILAWKLHTDHILSGPLKRIDTTIRWVLLAALLAVGLAGLFGALALPIFIALKFVLLAAAIFTGLMIRIVMRPLGAAMAGLAGAEPAKAADDIAAVLKRAKPFVVVIWVLIISAAILGLWRPNF